MVFECFQKLIGNGQTAKSVEKQMKKSLFRTAKIYLLGGLVGCFLGASGVPLVCFLNASCVLFGRFMGTSVVALGCFWVAFWVLFWSAFWRPKHSFSCRKIKKMEDNTFFDTYFVSAFTYPGALRRLCLFKSSGLLRVWSFGACWERPNYKK